MRPILGLVIVILLIAAAYAWGQTANPVSPGGSSERALGTDGGSMPAQIKVVGGKNGSTVQPIRVDSSGRLLVSAALTGKTSVDLVKNGYTVTPVSVAAYVEIVSQMPTDTTECEIFDSSGTVLKLAAGSAGSEVDQVYVVPGGNGRIPLKLNGGTRVSLKAIGTDATVGDFIMNCYQ